MVPTRFFRVPDGTTQIVYQGHVYLAVDDIVEVLREHVPDMLALGILGEETVARIPDPPIQKDDAAESAEADGQASDQATGKVDPVEPVAPVEEAAPAEAEQAEQVVPVDPAAEVLDLVEVLASKPIDELTIEEARQLCTGLGISFHPACNLTTLRRKLAERA